MHATPSRRQLLSTGFAVALTATAGCLELGGDDGDRDGDDGRALRLTLSRRGETLRQRFVVDLAETRPDWDEQAFEATLAGETYTTRHRKPFLSSPEDPTYARRDGTYYRLGSVVVDEATVDHPVLRLTRVDDPPERVEASAVDASTLPDHDQHAVQVAYLAARARGDEGGVPWGLVQRGGYVYRREEAAEASALLADDAPEHVTFRGDVYGVETTRETFHEPVYRATVDPVARTSERMEAILRARFVDARVERGDLSAAARDVLASASADGYSETHPYSESYREVLRALHRRAYLDGDVENDAGVYADRRRMLRYGEAYYDYRLEFVTAERE